MLWVPVSTSMAGSYNHQPILLSLGNKTKIPYPLPLDVSYK